MKIKILFRLSILMCGLMVYSQQPSVPSAPKPTIPTNPGVPGTSSTNISSVDETISYMNNLFSLYNKYNSSISVDASTGIFKFTDKFSILTANVRDIEFRRSNRNMGFYCKWDNSCITDINVNTMASKDDRTDYTFGIYDSDGNARHETDAAIKRLNLMLATVVSRLGGTSSNNSIISNNLNTINSAFSKYNAYNTVFSVVGNKLKWKSSVTEVMANFDNITFYINYSNKWIVIKCINQGCLEGSSFEDEYSMSLKTSSGEISPDMEKVLDAFNTLRREVLSN